MNCTTPGRNIKVFGRAIHCLAKIGEEIYFEGEASGLAVRTVNLSRSAYGTFLFQTSFFSKFSLQSQNSGELRCKVASRSCLPIFKNLASLERTVENFTIELKFREGEFIFTILHKSGLKKQHNLTFQECEGLSAVFNKNSSIIHLVSNNKFLSDCVLHFPLSVGEINLSVKQDHAMLSNYVEEHDQYSKVLQTQMKLVSSEFPQYNVSVERDITFCLKELRAILAFQDAVALPIHLYFDDPGRPIIMTVDGDGLYDCDFVLATLTDQNASQYSQSTNASKVVNMTTANATSTTANPTSTNSRSHANTTAAKPNVSRDDSFDEPNPFAKRKHDAIKRAPAPPQPDISKTKHPLPPPHVASQNRLSPPSSPELPASPPLHLAFSPPTPDQPLSPPHFSPSPPHFSPSPELDETMIDDELLDSLRGIPDAPDTPPNKRFKRLSSDDEDDASAIQATNNIIYCGESD